MPKILVVDDDVQVRNLLDKALSQKDYDPVCVPELEQATARIRQESFDLIVLDLKIREEKGMTLLKDLRKAKNDIPIVIYSGFITDAVERELREAGANEIVTKGGDVSELLSKIEKILKAGKRLFTGPTEGQTLLVVDDDDGIRGMLKQFFTRKGYKVLEAPDGEQALSIAGSEKINCVLLDVNMEGMSGLDVLPKLFEADPDIGVIMISGEGDDENVKAAMARGAYGYIIKPFDFVYLDLTVSSKLAIAASS